MPAFPSLELLAGVYLFAIVLSGPIQTQYIKDRVCHEAFGHADPAFCDSPEVAARTARWAQNTNLASAVPSLFIAAFMGSLSDGLVGRKPAILLATAGAVAASLANSIVYIYQLPLSTLYVGQVLFGLSGSYPLLLMACFASLIDATPLAARTTRVAVLEGCIYVGIVTGSLVSGPLISGVGYVNAYLVIVAALAVSFLLSLAGVRETWAIGRDGAPRSKGLPNPFRPVLMLARTRNLRLVGFCFMLTMVAFAGIPQVVIIFTSSFYHWGPNTIGYWLALDKLTRCTALFVVLPLLRRWLPTHCCNSDITLARLGALASAATYLVYGVVRSPYAMFAATAFGPLSGVTIPVLRSISSKNSPRTEQGSIMAAMAVMESTASIIAPLLFTQVYQRTVTTAPYAFILVGAGIQGVSLFALFFLGPPPAHLNEAMAEDNAGRADAAALLAGDGQLTKAEGLVQSRG